MAEKRGFDVTISSTTDRASFEGNGVASSFSLPFRFFSNGDIQASLIDDETGLVTPLSFGIDYTLLGAGAPEQAGSPESVITMVVAPAVGKTLFVQRVMEIVQPTDIVNQGRFFPEVHETVFDRLTMLVQQAALGPSRTIRVPEFDPIPGRLPSADARATKVFGFDENGDPAVSSLSMSAIEGQVIGAQGFAEAAAASAQDAELSAQDAGQSSVEAGESRDEAAAIADSLTGAAVPLFSVMWWPSRAIPEGYIAADGQALLRATYPDAWAGINAGNVPTVADATWISTPTERGKFTAGDGSTTFRLPDYNGKFAGSLGAVFLRGDGTLSAAIAGVIQRDAFQGHHHLNKYSSTYTGYGNAGSGWASNFVTGGSDATTTEAFVTTATSDGVNGTPRTASETRPLNVTGCWVIKLFGAVVNVGSADAAQLASDYANLASALQTLDSQIDFTIIYPNGGSEGSPANASANSRIVVSNPFPGFYVDCLAEVLYNSIWGPCFSNASNEARGFGVRASQAGAGDIIVQTGQAGLLQTSSLSGSPHGFTGDVITTPLPCRVKVWKVKGAVV